MLILFASGNCSSDGWTSPTYIEDTIMIHVYPQDSLNGMSELKLSTYHFKLFPNPNNGNFKLSGYGINKNALLDVGIYDTKGVHMEQLNLKSDSVGAFSSEIHVEKLTAGVYFLKLISKNETQIVRINIVR